MKGINKVILLGNLGKDPEVRQTQTGSMVTNITIATNETWKDKDGKQQEQTEWHKVVFFGRLAEVVAQYLKKGAKVYVEGKINTKKWKDKNGNDQYTTQITASEMQMLDGASGEKSVQSNAIESPRQSLVSIEEENIPF